MIGVLSGLYNEGDPASAPSSWATTSSPLKPLVPVWSPPSTTSRSRASSTASSSQAAASHSQRSLRTTGPPRASTIAPSDTPRQGTSSPPLGHMHRLPTSAHHQQRQRQPQRPQGHAYDSCYASMPQEELGV